MKQDTRAQIIATAQRLFNDRGYSEVSMRDIADETGISPGNLTYHFGKKEELIDAMVCEMREECRLALTVDNIEELGALFTDIQLKFSRHAFCMLDYVQLARRYPDIRRLQNEVILEMSHVLHTALENLREKGQLGDEVLPGQYECLTQVILLILICWMPQNRVESGLIQPCTFMRQIWSVLYPMLTDDGRLAYEKLRGREEAIPMNTVNDADDAPDSPDATLPRKQALM